MTRERRAAWFARAGRPNGRRSAIALALGIGAAPLAAQQKAPLVLNHLVAILDSATYADLQNSPFIAGQFAATDRVGGGVDPVTSGLRLYGKYNYLVLAPPPPTSGPLATGRFLRPSGVGIVLSDERASATGIKWTTTMVCSDCVTTSIDGDVWEMAPQWFGDSATGLAFLNILRYGAAGAKRLAAKDSLPESNRSNGRFLAPWFDAKKLFAYLTGATFAMPVDHIKQIMSQLRTQDVTVAADGEGAIIRLDGFTLHLIPPYRGAGVKQLQFALTHAAPANPTYRFGPKSQLRFGPGLIAVWDFDAK